MKRIIFVLLTIISGLFAAVKPDVVTSVQPEQARIGDHFTVNYTVTAPAGFALLFPQITEDVLGSPILEQKTSVKVKRNVRTQVVEIISTSFDTGFVKIPAIPIVYGDSSGFSQHDTLFTPVKYIYIGSVLDSARQAAPMASPLPLSLMLWWQYLVALVLAAGGILLLWRGLAKKTSAEQKEIEVAPWRSPEEEAEFALDELEKKRYTDQAQWKEFYLELTVILKKYFESIYYIHLRELSTKEVLPQLKTVLDVETFVTVCACLRSWDMVKFAKQGTDKRSCEKDLAVIKKIVHSDNRAKDIKEGKLEIAET